MKKFLFLSAMMIAVLQLAAAPVDVATAQSTAQRFVMSQHNRGGSFNAPVSVNLRLVHSEASSMKSSQPVYYIFNSADNFIIVSGDDRAHAILAYGDEPLDMAKMPDNMKMWLEGYKKQMEYLLSHPDMVVQNESEYKIPQVANSVSPLLTALWDQGYPYNLHCPEYNGATSVTGCAATSLAMVFYYWKYPTGPTPSVSGYTTESHGLQLSGLPSTTFDWDNMRDHYFGGFTNEQADAVAWLMRYIGQSERMDYSPSSSGTGSYDILQTIRRFGYDHDVRLVSKESWWSGENYSDEEWGAIIQEELANARPIVMCAYTPTYSGHAFNIDGYDATDDTYHINWGWSGTGNAFYALNAFRGGGAVFNVGQQLLIGIEPPATVPTIKPWFSRLYPTAYVDSTAVSTFNVKGALLTGDVTLTLQDENDVFTIDTQQIALSELRDGKQVTVTYSPKAVGTHTATVTLSSEGAEDKIVTLIGSCILETYDPVMLDASDVEESSFVVNWEDFTPGHNVVDYRLEVARVPFYEERLAEAFENNPIDGTSSSDCSSRLDEYTSTPGWTGSKIYRSSNNLILGSSKSKGWIETPDLDMYGNNGLITVKVYARGLNSEGTAPLKISCGDKDTLINLTSEFQEYCVLLPCRSNNKARVRLTGVTGVRVLLSSVEFFAGDNFTPVDMSTAEYYEQITGSSYLVRNMNPGCYAVRVQATYTDGGISEWSNRTRVMIDWVKGDVNHDGEINVSDANMVIDYIMRGAMTRGALSVGDVNGDGEININDINMIINIILNH